jgi:chromosome segregation ATPase
MDQEDTEEDLTIDGTSLSECCGDDDLKAMEAHLKKLTLEKTLQMERIVQYYRAKISKLTTENRETTDKLNLTKYLLKIARKEIDSQNRSYARLSRLKSEDEAEVQRQKNKIDELEVELRTIKETLEEERTTAMEIQKKRKALVAELQDIEPHLSNDSLNEQDTVIETDICELNETKTSSGHAQQAADTTYTPAAKLSDGHEPQASDTNRSATNVSHSTMLIDPKWERHLRPHFNDVMQALSLKVLPLLYSNKLIDKLDYARLATMQAQERRNEILLLEILMKAGIGSFDKFCSILRAVDGQKPIADMIDPIPTKTKRQPVNIAGKQ